MTPKERILTIRLLEKAGNYPELANKLGLDTPEQEGAQKNGF